MQYEELRQLGLEKADPETTKSKLNKMTRTLVFPSPEHHEGSADQTRADQLMSQLTEYGVVYDKIASSPEARTAIIELYADPADGFDNVDVAKRIWSSPEWTKQLKQYSIEPRNQDEANRVRGYFFLYGVARYGVDGALNSVPDVKAPTR